MENKTVRKRAMQKSLDAILQEVLDVLEADDGRSFEEKKALAIDMLRCKEDSLLANKLVDMAIAETDASQLKDTFWSASDEIYAENGILLRKVKEADREKFLDLQRIYSATKTMLQQEAYCNMVWNEHTQSKSLMLSIEKNGSYVGYCGIQDITKKTWEISIELVPDSVHQGIGFTALTAMLNELKDRLWVNDFRVRIEPTNYASQRLFEKLGAVPNGISELWIHDQETIEQLESENQHLINDDLVAVAQKFSVQPQQLLSHVLEYTLKW